MRPAQLSITSGPRRRRPRQNAEGQRWQGCLVPLSDRHTSFEPTKTTSGLAPEAANRGRWLRVRCRDRLAAHETVSRTLQEAKPRAVAARRYRRRCRDCPRGENPEAAVELPLDRPPVQSCMRRRLAIVHTASGTQCPIPHYATAGHSKKMLEAALQETACGRERWKHRNSDAGLAEAMPLSPSPAGRSNTAKGQTSRALPRRQAAARLCGPRNRGERNIAATKSNRRCMIRGGRLPAGNVSSSRELVRDRPEVLRKTARTATGRALRRQIGGNPSRLSAPQADRGQAQRRSGIVRWLACPGQRVATGRR